MENLNLDKSYKDVAFLGLTERLFSIFNLKRLSLNLQIYFRVTIVFLKKLPAIIYIFLRDLPKNLKKEGSKIKVHRRKFELAKIWPHLGIAILSCVVISSSVFAQGQSNSNTELTQNTLEPSEYADFALAADPYTPFIDEQGNQMIAQLAQADSVVVSDESYILAPADIATEKSPKESTAPSNRTAYLTYQVMSGETLSYIGAKFNLSSSTILWANTDIKNANILQPGSSLLIPPRDGITIVVNQGQSLDSLVKKYSGNFDETLAANAITDPATIFSGQKILIADGKPAKAPVSTPQIAKKSTGKVKGTSSSPTGPTVPTGTFIWPCAHTSISQYFSSRHPGIDILDSGSAPPIYAADGGVVVEARYGWNGGYGNTVLIDHGNGFQTRYGHMSVLVVSEGQHVSQGQQVGVMGSTGNSTGTHLHFEIHLGPAKLNPLAYLS